MKRSLFAGAALLAAVMLPAAVNALRMERLRIAAFVQSSWRLVVAYKVATFRSRIFRATRMTAILSTLLVYLTLLCRRWSPRTIRRNAGSSMRARSQCGSSVCDPC